MTLDTESKAERTVRLGVLYFSIIGILGTAGRWMVREIFGDFALPIGLLGGIFVGVVVVWRLHRFNLPKHYVDLGVFVVAWSVLTFLIVASSVFWISPFVGVNLSEYFTEITVPLFLLGFLWYLATKWPNYLGRALAE